MGRITIKELEKRIDELKETNIELKNKVYDIVKPLGKILMEDDNFMEQLSEKVLEEIDIDDKISDEVDNAVNDLQVSR